MVNTMKNTGQNGSVHHRFVEAQRRRTEDCHVALDAVIAYLFADSEKGKIDLLRTIFGCVVRSQPFHEWCLIDRKAVVRHYSCYMSSRDICFAAQRFHFLTAVASDSTRRRRKYYTRVRQIVNRTATRPSSWAYSGFRCLHQVAAPLSSHREIFVRDILYQKSHLQWTYTDLFKS